MTKDQLIEKLNDDLSNEYAAIIQYTTYAAQATGPYRPQLVAFFKSEIADEQGHAQFLADKIMTLGGTPATKAAPVKAASTNKEMLEAVLEAESKAIENYKKRAIEADELGFKALALDLEDMVRDETNHKEETEKILRDWPL